MSQVRPQESLGISFPGIITEIYISANTLRGLLILGHTRRLHTAPLSGSVRTRGTCPTGPGTDAHLPQPPLSCSPSTLPLLPAKDAADPDTRRYPRSHVRVQTSYQIINSD